MFVKRAVEDILKACKHPLFITLEGIEGSGKSTQAQRLYDRLGDRGVAVLHTYEPGATRSGAAIRKVLLDPMNHGLSPLAELFLYAADRAQHVQEIIRPALAQGRWVLCDRFADATTVYQGLGRGLDKDLVQQINQMACGGLQPDITFVFDCPVEVGLKRARRRNAGAEGEREDRFELEQNAFHQRIRDGYLLLAQQEPERFRVVDATLGEEELERVMWEEILAYVKSRGSRRRHGL